MLNLTKRVHRLLEKTTSLETKKVCKEVMEMYTSVSEEQLAMSLVEKLKGVADSDKYVSSFVLASEKIMSLKDLGITKAISNIRESQSYHYPALRYSLDRFERLKITEGTEDYLMVEDFLTTLKDFTWDKNVAESLDTIRAKFEENKENVLVSRALYEFRKARGNFLYEGVCNMLEDHFENPTQASRSALIENLQKFTFSPVAKNLLENLKKFQSSASKSLQLVSENGACTVSPVYSTILLENGKEYFSVKGDVFKKSGSLVEKVGSEEYQTLSENIKRSHSIFNSPYFFVKEGKASFYVGRNKVEIFESNNTKTVSFNGKVIPGNDIAKNLVSAGMLRLEEAKVASDIQFVNEIFESFYELDFAKVITSKMYEGSYAAIMKIDEKIYLNKVNPSMKTNEFFTDINATQARNIVLEFLGYDIKESMVEFLEKEEAEMRAIRESQLGVLNNMAIVEGELAKLEGAKKDAYLAATPQIKTLEETLRKELVNLKSQYTKLSEQLKKFEAATSDADVEVGQDVKLTESGETATVSSIDSNSNTIKVVTTKGETKVLKSGEYTSLEEVKEVSFDRNEDKADDEQERVEDEERPKMGDEEEVDEALSAKQKTLPVALQKAILKKQGEDPDQVDDKEKKEKKGEKIDEENIIAGGTDVPVENPNRDDFPAQQPEQPEQEETEYVKAIVSQDQGGSAAGQEVDILASDYASKGDEDLIQVKLGDEIFFIEKKHLQVSTEEADDSLTIDFDATAPGEEKKEDDEEKDDEETISFAEEPPAEEPAEEPKEEPTPEGGEGDLPAEEPVEEPVEEPKEELAEEPKEEPEPAEEPKEEPAEEPKEEPAEEPKEEPAPEGGEGDLPAEEPAEEPSLDSEEGGEGDLSAEEPTSNDAPADKSEEEHDAEENDPATKLEKLRSKLKKALEDLEDIKLDMGDTFTSNETISTTIFGVKGLMDALGKDLTSITESKKKK